MALFTFRPSVREEQDRLSVCLSICLYVRQSMPLFLYEEGYDACAPVLCPANYDPGSAANLWNPNLQVSARL